MAFSAAGRSFASRSSTRTLVAAGDDAHVGDALLTELRACILRQLLQRLIDRRLEVDFVHEVHATAQIESEAHRFQSDAAQERRCPRDAGQRDDVVGLRRLADEVARAQLFIDVREAQHETIAFYIRRLGGNPFVLQNAGDALLISGRNRSPIVARQLNRVVLAEEIGDGEQQTDDEDDADQPIAPPRNLIHAKLDAQALLMVPLGSICAIAWRCTFTLTPGRSRPYERITQLDYLAEDAAVSSDFCTGLERRNHRAMFLGALLWGRIRRK